MAMMDLPIQVQIKSENGTTQVSVSGNVTDHSDLSQLADIQSPRVILDLAHLHRLNSRGVVLWMQMMEQICKKSPRVEIRNASHGFMQHYGMIRRFTATAHIESVQAIFQCEKCGGTRTVTLERSRDFPDGHVQPAQTPDCSRCRRAMVPDDAVFEMTL